MGFYRTGEPDPEVPTITERLRAHPLWYGLGCLLALLVPLLAFGLSVWLIQLNATYRWFPIPPQLIRREPVPIIGRIPPLTPLYLTLTGVLTFFLLGVITVIYALIYRLLGGSPYTPYDAID